MSKSKNDIFSLRKAFLWLAISWISISVLYLFSGLLIILNADIGIIDAFNNSDSSSWISAIAACFSAIAAMASLSSAGRAASAAEQSNLNTSLMERIKAKSALTVFWSILNQKVGQIPSQSGLSDHFLFSNTEISILEDQREILQSASAYFGEEIHSRINHLYINAMPELRAQQQPCDYDHEGKMTLQFESQKRYSEFRKSTRDKAYALLIEMDSMIFDVK